MRARTALTFPRRVLTRNVATQTTTTAQVPDDPDILDTQSDEIGAISQDPPSDDTSTRVDLSKPYPRLQYRSPALGINPAFDLALDLLNENKREITNKILSTKQRIRMLKASARASTKFATIHDLKSYLAKLEELVDVNDPEIRWRHKHGDIDLKKPIFRLLAKQSWQEKAARLLEQRITQMFVTPDVIPIISPIVDVRLAVPDSAGNRARTFEAGQFLETAQGRHLPQIDIQSFEGGSKKYTIAIIDPDVPDEASDTYKSYLHYLKKDIILDETNHRIDSSNGTVLLDYVPPHPQKGTPYHRYTVVVWEQPETDPQPYAPEVNIHVESRSLFHAQHYAQQHGLHAVGINFWRQVWDAEVSSVMKEYPAVYYKEKNFKRIKA